ncbi:MAG: tRNA (adenosine(37)-N6)-threonylcarbamoyltransferase complex ATPase subunit type 1 TsaE [Cyclobacteriaceae bacterium]|nr:tRNA (adenosine(37)-N6)-threonylcarbamoyltransferase complex ATPase subunit type 1 TsaE [Cyclobacteriaceae bacterium]
MPEQWKLLHESSLTLSDLPVAAKQLVNLSKGQVVWLLHGEMGSGKTTLVKSLMKELGIASLVTSPTFSIVNEYGESEENTVYHFDFYRLKNETEALDIGFEEYLTSGKLCLIEWPEKVINLLPEKVFEVKIEFHDAVSRKIYFRTHE